VKTTIALLLLLTSLSPAMETNQSSVALPGSAWKVTSLAAQDPLADHPITFEFDAEGSISGNASCNTFSGACTIEGNSMKTGPLRSTRRACEPEVMQQEQKFLALLGSVTRWEIGQEGQLVLHGEGGEIRATRHSEASEN